MTAICGDTCTVTSTGLSNVLGHSFSIELTSNEIDVRAFGSGDYGDWIACNKAGTITFNSYNRPDFDPGETLTFTANVGSETISGPAVVISQSINVDAKSVVEFTTVMRASNVFSIT